MPQAITSTKRAREFSVHPGGKTLASARFGKSIAEPHPRLLA